MSGASRESSAAARGRLESVIESASVDAARLAEELLAVTRLLDREVGLRRVLTDPARKGEAKAQLAGSLLSGQVGAETADLVSELVRSRWSSSRDLVDTLEQLAAMAEIVDADRAGVLDDVEDELFRFGRIVAGNPALRAALTDPAAGSAAKTDLVKRLLEGKAKPATVRLIVALVTQPRGRSLDGGLEEYSRLAAGWRDRVVALVTTAVPLSDSQRERLGTSLTRLVGRRVHLNAVVDPTVLGGVRVQIGDEIIEGTIASRLDSARQGLAG